MVWFFESKQTSLKSCLFHNTCAVIIGPYSTINQFWASRHLGASVTTFLLTCQICRTFAPSLLFLQIRKKFCFKTWKENGNYDSHLLHSAHAWSNGALSITSDGWFRTEESLNFTPDGISSWRLLSGLVCNDVFVALLWDPRDLNLASCHVQLIQFGRIKLQITSKCTFLRPEPHLVAHVILYTRII